MKTNDNEDDTMKNKGGKYSIFVRVTFVIFISSLVTSFIAAQKVEKVVDIDSDKSVDAFEINEEGIISNNNSNSNSNSNVDDDAIVKAADDNKKEYIFGNKTLNKSSNQSSNTSSDSGGQSQEQTDTDDGEVVLVKDKNIFSNEYFDDNVIAPGVSGTYNFNVTNNRKSKVIYKIITNDVNTSKINLQYRLKCESGYVIGDEDTWVSISDLNIKNITLNSNESHLYVLEWRWPYESGNDDLDTEIGELGDAEYVLRISIYAEDV